MDTCLEDETLLVKIKVIQEEALQRPFGFGEFVGPFMVSVLHSQPKSHSAKTEKTDLVSIFFLRLLAQMYWLPFSLVSSRDSSLPCSLITHEGSQVNTEDCSQTSNRIRERE